MRSALCPAALVPPFSFQRSGVASRWRLAVVVLCLLVAGVPARGQQETDSRLLSIINTIRAVDNHSHGLPARDLARAVAAPTDPLGKSVPFFSVRQRETNPEWIEAWRTLYAYPHRDGSPDHAREAFSAKRRVEQEKGNDYPSWVLDQAGIEFALINAPALGRGQAAPRFRWVPYADGFLYPFATTDPAGNVLQRRRTEAGLEKTPASWTDFLAVVRKQLTEWKTGGAVAVKFTTAYYRSLDFAPVAETDARRIYEQYVRESNTTPRDYRASDYRALQDFLFRYVAREAGRVGLVVHVHTGAGAGPVFPTAGSNPLLVESALNDFSLAGTTFVLVHGGFPFDREMTALIQKPNVYTDISGMSFFHSRHELSETLRMWLWAFPEKVLFGTDAFTSTALRGWEEMTWLASRSGREALARALTAMMTEGDITHDRATEVALLVLRDNALKLYGLSPQPTK